MQDTSRGTALVAGATGVVGRRLAEHMAAIGGWRVVGLMRRPPADRLPFQTIAVDLTCPASCRQALTGLGDVTHILYAARYDHVTTAPEPIDTNLAMLRNLLDAVLPQAKGLRHVHLVHGMKAYGATLGPYKTPAKETDPRVLADNFYYAQEDLVRDLRAGQAWSWTISRPQGICEEDPSAARSMGKLIAIYAAISRELAMPFCFPGIPAGYGAIYQCTDTRHLARAIAWMATEPACADQVFNVTNGDCIRWCNLWPGFAEHFRMPLGPPRPVRLGEVMRDKQAVWERIAARHGLERTPYEALTIWSYGDFIFNSGYDHMSDLTKLRRFGFHDVVDTEAMFLAGFERLRRERIIP